MSGYDDTDDWSHTFNDEGDYLVEGQAFDYESAYSDPVSWTVHVETNHPPTASRENPSSSEVTIKVGDTLNFEIRAHDVDGDLRGAEWYLEHSPQESHFDMSGYDDTDDWSHTFNNEGDYLVEGQAFDYESAYSDPVSWTVHVECEEERIIEFSGHNWIVKSGWGGPGPNYWSNSPENVWVDE